jgi:streptogramin lyase
MKTRLSAVALALATLLVGAQAGAQTKVWTTTADFDQGTLNNVSDTKFANQVVLGPTPVSQTHLVWATNYLYGYVVRIDSQTGKQTSRFDSALVTINGTATGAQAAQTYCDFASTGNCPGRVAVDTNGDVWIVNRAFNQQGTLSKFSGNLAHCIDRNNNGVIDTSFDKNNDGLIDVTPAAGEYFGQNDECILATIKVGPVNALPRGVAVDKYGKIWVNTYNDGKLYRYNPNEPVALEAVVNIGGNPYSLATGGDYVFASNRGGGGTKRVHITTLAVQSNTNCPATYGVVADPAGGWAWLGGYTGDGVYKADFTNNTCPKYAATGGQTTAVTLDLAGNVWVANYQNATLHKVSPAGVLLGTYPAGGTLPHGLSVDFQGNVWAILHGPPSVAKINPNTGAIIGTYTIGHASIANADPYLYSDFTGVQIDRQAPYTYVGSWDGTYDGGVNNIPWGKVTWNTEPQGAVPALSSLVVSARAANSLAGLGTAAYAPVTSGAALSGIVGRYVQVRADLKGPGFVTAVLSDVVVSGPCPTIGDACCVQDSDCNDANSCTTDTCPTPGGACQHAPVPNCCLTSAGCNDGNACTTDNCPFPGGQCTFSPIPGCCNSNTDCGDNNPCTVDLCSGQGGMCSHPVINGCCIVDLDCTKGNKCSNATCPTPGGFCTGGSIPGCCSQDSDCADTDLCTLDACDLATSTCTNTAVPGCCNTDGQCDDGNACTQDHCSGPGGMCVHSPIPGCCTPTDPKVGTPCDVPQSPYDKAPCKPGQFVCTNGTFTCQGAVKPSFEVCNGLDDNCDGIIDNVSPSGPALCPTGKVCVTGVCVGPCDKGEFPCGAGLQCVNGYCIPTDCSQVTCPPGETCAGGLCTSGDGGMTSSSSSSSSTSSGSSTSSSSSSSSGGAGGGGTSSSGSSSGSASGSSSGDFFGLATGGACRCDVVGGSDDGARHALLVAALGLAAGLGRSRRRRNGGAR